MAAAKSSKSLQPEQNERIRGFVQRLIDDRFAGNVTAAAEKIGVSQSLLYEFLKGTRGAGMKLLGHVAEYSGWSIDDIVNGAPSSGERASAIELDPRYPNCAEAAALARKIGVSERGIKAVLNDALKFNGDPAVSEWLRQMTDRARWFDQLDQQAAQDLEADVATGTELVRSVEQMAAERRGKARSAASKTDTPSPRR